MARKVIGNLLNREQLLNMNNNFTELYEKVNEALSYSQNIIDYEDKLKETIEEYDNKQIENNSIDNSKLMDGTIQPEKTSFFTKTGSNNLLNLATLLKNKSIDTAGNIVDAPNYWLTDYILVDSRLGEQINVSNDGTNSYRISIHDENKKFLGRPGITGDTKFVPNPSTQAMYVRISGTRDINTVMINKGASLLPYETPITTSSGYKLKDELYDTEIEDNSIDNSKLVDGTIQPEKTSFIKNTFLQKDIKITPDNEVHFQKPVNLFNRNIVQYGKTLDSDGNIVNDDKYILSAPIKAKGKKIAMSTDNSVRWGIYNKDGAKLGRGGKIQGSTNIIDLTKSPDAEYVLLSIVKTSADRFMVNYGDYVLPYENFEYKLISTSEYPLSISNDIVPTGANSSNTTQVVSGNVIDLKGTSQIYRDISSSFNSKDTTEVYSTNAKSQIDYIEFSTNNINAELILTYVDDKGTNKTSTITNPSDNSELPLTLDNIVNYGYPNTDFIVYDPTKAIYKIAIKDLKFSNGFKLVAKNSGSINANIGVKLVGRYYV